MSALTSEPAGRSRRKPACPACWSMVRTHGVRMSRDALTARPLTSREWRLAEADLVRLLERQGC